MAHKVAIIVLLSFLLVNNLAIAYFGSAQAQSIPKPSVPEFTVSIDDHSYDVQATTTTTTDLDGRRITTTTPGYHMVNGTITISIKNQPFTPYYDSDGYPINLYYLYVVRSSGNSIQSYPDGDADSYHRASNSEYTTFDYWYSDLGGLSKMDIQVEAFIGHTNTTHIITPGIPVDRASDYIIKYVGQTSGWSQIQTVTIPNNAYTQITTNPTTAPTLTAPTQISTQPHYQDLTTPSGTQTALGFAQPQLSLLELALLIVVGVVFALLAAVIFFLRRRIRVLELKRNGT